MTVKAFSQMFLRAAVMLLGVASVSAFTLIHQPQAFRCSLSGLYATGNKEDPSTSKPKNFLEDLKGMLSNFDDVVDDFVMKRMGAGEQWYGKRKYSPSGRVEGDYNGMGRSSHYAIEIARVQKEVLEERKQRRLEEEAARRNE